MSSDKRRRTGDISRSEHSDKENYPCPYIGCHYIGGSRLALDIHIGRVNHSSRILPPGALFSPTTTDRSSQPPSHSSLDTSMGTAAHHDLEVTLEVSLAAGMLRSSQDLITMVAICKLMSTNLGLGLSQPLLEMPTLTRTCGWTLLPIQVRDPAAQPPAPARMKLKMILLSRQ